MKDTTGSTNHKYFMSISRTDFHFCGIELRRHIYLFIFNALNYKIMYKIDVRRFK